MFRDSTADKRRTYKDLLHKDKKGVMDLKVNFQRELETKESI